jgi:hypothetical protein
MRRLLTWLTGKMKPPRVIRDREDGGPYLSRSYLHGTPVMPDGSSPFDEHGDMRKGAEWPSRFGLYLHRFHRGDSAFHLHNHPWGWSLSLVLAGGYIEERRQRDGSVTRRTLRPGHFNWIRGEDFHRVDLIESDAWTLFLAGPKLSGWGFWDRVTGSFTPWREYLQRKREGKTS